MLAAQDLKGIDWEFIGNVDSGDGCRFRGIRRSSAESFEPLLVAGQVPPATADAAAQVTGQVERVLGSLMLVLQQYLSHERGFGAIDAPGFLLPPGKQAFRQLKSQRFHEVMVIDIQRNSDTKRMASSLRCLPLDGCIPLLGCVILCQFSNFWP